MKNFRNEWKIPSDEIKVVKEGKSFQSRITVASAKSSASFNQSMKSSGSGGIDQIGTVQQRFKAGKAVHVECRAQI